jgi:hypothetical protein
MPARTEQDVLLEIEEFTNCQVKLVDSLSSSSITIQHYTDIGCAILSFNFVRIEDEFYNVN